MRRALTGPLTLRDSRGARVGPGRTRPRELPPYKARRVRFSMPGAIGAKAPARRCFVRPLRTPTCSPVDAHATSAKWPGAVSAILS